MNSAPFVPSGYEDQIEEAKIYLEKHKIPQVLESITQALVFERPNNPNEFIIKKLEGMVAARARGHQSSLSEFTRENISAVFKILDVTSRGHISLEKYYEGMKSLGLDNCNTKPPGADNNKIILDTFISEVNKAINKK